MKKEGMENHHHGLLGWSLALVGIISSVVMPFAGLIFGIVALIINNKESKKYKNEWTKVGKILSITAIVVSAVLVIVAIIIAAIFPGLMSQIGIPG